MSNLTGTYVLDPAHSRIGFVVRHAMVTKVRGNFEDFEGTLVIGEDNSAKATIKTGSINTGAADRDAHVKGDDFFSVDKFPEMTFEATSVDVDENGNGKVTGDLTIKGVTKSVVLDVESDGIAEDPFGAVRLGFEAKTTINRRDYGIDFQAPLKAGGMLVSDEVKIEIEGSAIKQ